MMTGIGGSGGGPYGGPGGTLGQGMLGGGAGGLIGGGGSRGGGGGGGIGGVTTKGGLACTADAGRLRSCASVLAISVAAGAKSTVDDEFSLPPLGVTVTVEVSANLVGPSVISLAFSPVALTRVACNAVKLMLVCAAGWLSVIDLKLMVSSMCPESTRLSWYADIAERARRLDDTVTEQSVMPAHVELCVACRELSAQAASQLAGKPTPTLVVASMLEVCCPLPTDVAPCKLLTMAVRLAADEEVNSKSTAV